MTDPNQSACQSIWDEWPKWDNDNVFRTKNFTFVGSVSTFDGKTDGNQIAILKHRQFINIYRELLADHPKNIFELGYFQGGMPLFIADMQEEEHLGDSQKQLHIAAVDYHPPTDALKHTIAKHQLDGTIHLHGGILQEDTATIRSIIQAEYGDESLDLIIDDCSHQYHETKVCFQAFFSHLKPGGKYVIEDWGWQHWPGEPWQSENSPFYGKPSMTNLIHELVMAMGTRPDIIARIDVVSEFCVIVTRGPALVHGDELVLAQVTQMANRPYIPM
ncbi:MAG: class I SAM-dependent methyltransferase [Synechococcaceae cyanobacterium]|jgi:cephalosporin hydroxylase